MTIVDPSLVLLVGPSGAGKSTFARRHFAPGTILSSDALREMIAGDANDQAASGEAFQVLSVLVNGRLGRRLLTVVDATNIRSEARRRWLRAARRHGLPAVAICFDLPLETYLACNRARPERQVPDSVVIEQAERMRRAMKELPGEGFDGVWVIRSAEWADQVEVALAG